MIFKEVQHIWLEVSQKLPVAGYACRRLPELNRHAVVIDILLDHCTQSVV